MCSLNACDRKTIYRLTNRNKTKTAYVIEDISLLRKIKHGNIQNENEAI